MVRNKPSHTVCPCAEQLCDQVTYTNRKVGPGSEFLSSPCIFPFWMDATSTQVGNPHLASLVAHWLPRYPVLHLLCADTLKACLEPHTCQFTPLLISLRPEHKSHKSYLLTELRNCRQECILSKNLL
jgi:hypothetical protein